MTAPTDFLARHPDPDHRYLPAVRVGLERGKCEGSERHSHRLGEGFVRTYGRRARGLARRTTPHAKQLKSDTEELLRHAEADAGVETWWWRFELPKGRSIVFVERKRDHAILGALALVSKLGVTEAEWEELWGG